MVVERLHRMALRVYRSLPELARRWVVRIVAPIYSVGSICLIERADGRVLLVRQAYRTRWGIPGGLLERRESPADAAIREVAEEVGLVIELLSEPVVVVDVVPQRVDIVYRARPVDGQDLDALEPQTAEIVELGWFAPDAMPELQPETASALVTLARSARSPQSPSLTADLWSPEHRND